MVDVDLAHLDAVVDRVAHELGRGVEAHRLGVEDGGAEHVGVVALEPGRDVDQEREAGGVALGEAVIAEALDLLEAGLGEVAVVAARDHALDQLGAKRSIWPERRNAAIERRRPSASLGVKPAATMAIFIACSWNRGTPRVLPSTVAQLVGGELDRLDAVAAAQIGVDHVALDRAGADDRDLDHQVVEGARLEPGQHRHLRPALDLEHADRIGAAEHLVDGGVLGRDGGEREGDAVMRAQQLEALADAGQHAERQHVDLEHPQRVEIVLVPLDHGAVGHGRVLDRDQLAQGALRDDEAADMLAEMAREAQQLPGQLEGPAQGRVVGVEPGLAQGRLGRAPRGRSPRPCG